MEVSEADGKAEEKVTKKEIAVRFQLPGNEHHVNSANSRSHRNVVRENKKSQGIYCKRQSPVRESQWNRFRVMYDNGDLPVRLEHSGIGNASRTIGWLEDLKEMPDERFMDLLVKFSLGLPVLQYPYGIIAERGFLDLLKRGGNSELIISCFPQIIRPLHAALSSTEAKKMMALRVICQIAQLPQCGPALVPYYRHLITPLRILSDSKVHDIEYKYGKSVAECVEATLNLLERTGGPKAFPVIKSIVPTYESCMWSEKPQIACH